MAKYVDLVLEPGEVLRFRTTVSRIVYCNPALLTIVCVWVLFQLNDWGSEQNINLVLLMVVFCAWRWLRVWRWRVGTEIAVTSRRIIFKTGFGPRTTDELNLASLEGVHLSQGWLGRWFDFGRVIIDGRSGKPWGWGNKPVDSPIALRATMTASGGSNA